ncbi:MAG: hypothetical protein NWQ11_07000, partial [Pseudomonadales bacterium]|nr:hypothetical protein [Pseudomonadales bacterium]
LKHRNTRPRYPVRLGGTFYHLFKIYQHLVSPLKKTKRGLFSAQSPDKQASKKWHPAAVDTLHRI